jgi:hypothetical protein
MMAQQSAMQGANAPMIPQGTPEPDMQPEAEMAMAGGGVTSLPVGDMNFGSGGIIAFANPEGDQLVEDPMGTGAEAIMRAEKGKPDNRNIIERLLNAPEEPEWKRKLREEREAREQAKNQPAPPAPPAAPAAPPSGIVTTLPANVVQQRPPRPQPAVPPAPPVAPVQTDAQKFQSGILAGTGLPTLPPEYAPPKQAPIGEEYTAYMNERLAKRKADEDKFKQRESGRSQRDFFNSLIAAGEATRGQKGIGSLFGGFGKAYSQSATEAEDRQSAFEQKQQELADNDAKTKFEIANLRRAEERNDSKAVYESKVKLTELSQQRVQLQGQVANQMSGNESAERVARANNLTQLEVARINQATAMKPGETERLMAQYGALKAKDPKAAEQFMVDLERIKTGSRGENAQQKLSLQRQALAEKLPIYQMALSSYINEKDPAKKATALTKVREIEGMHGIKSEESSTGSKVIDFSKIP